MCSSFTPWRKKKIMAHAFGEVKKKPKPVIAFQLTFYQRVLHSNVLGGNKNRITTNIL